MRKSKWWFMLVMVGVLAVLLAACGGDDDNNNNDNDNDNTNDNAGQPSDQSAQADVVIQNSAFNPASLDVAVGSTVTWYNDDSQAHTVTSGAPSTPDGFFDSGNIDPEGSFTFTFDQPGTYTYFCSIHPEMTGTINVTGGADTGGAAGDTGGASGGETGAATPATGGDTGSTGVATATPGG